MNRYNLKSYEVDAFVEFFMHRLGPKQRVELMREFPTIYQKVTGVKMSVQVELSVQVEPDEVSVRTYPCLDEAFLLTLKRPL